MKGYYIFFLSLLLLSYWPAMAQQKVNNEFRMEGEEGKGLRADYFNGANFEEKVLTRIEAIPYLNLNKESPAPGVNAENYSVRWTGHLYAPVTGRYKVFVRVDDGIRFWVNGYLMLDKWKLQRATTYSGYLNLEGGEFYTLKIEYCNMPQISVLQLMWESPEDKTSFFGFFEKTPRKIIPTKYLYAKLPEKEEAKPKEKDIKKEEPASFIAEKKKKSTRKKEQARFVERESEDKNIRKEEPIPLPAEKKKGNTLKNEEARFAERNPEEKMPAINAVPAAEELYENLKPGAVVRFKNVLFEQGKYILLKDSYPELDKLARTMIKYPGLKIRIEGHTDNVGDPGLNESLSFFRAKVVETHLLENGIDRSRIEIKGYGSSRPLADNAAEEGRAKNRRVEFVVR